MAISRDALRDMLDPGASGRATRLLRLWHFVAVLAGLATVIAGSLDEIWTSGAQPLLRAVSYVIVACFAIEYGLRLLIAADDQWETERWSAARWRWILTPIALVDLAAFLPIPLALAAGLPAQQTLLFSVLWVFKLVRYSTGLGILARVVRLESEPLLGVLLAFLIALFMAATLAYLLERDAQPEAFGNIPKALWWAITTLTTTGYGDAVPQTPFGRMLGGLVMICGIMLFALWAGILATGFSEEVRRREFLRTYDLVHKVPFFHDLGASLIAELARLLKPREFPGGATVVRRGQPGDCMYFIASGEIEVRTGARPLHLHAGGFFGEIALITGGPRTATAVATKHTMLLILDIADFRDLAARRPELSQAIHDEAERRLKRAHPTGATPGAAE